MQAFMELITYFEYLYKISVLVNHISQTLYDFVNPLTSNEINTYIPSISLYVLKNTNH